MSAASERAARLKNRKPAKPPFDKAHASKVALSKEAEKKLKNLYVEAAKEIKAELNKIPKGVALDKNTILKRVQLQNALLEINKVLDRFNLPQQQIIIDYGTKAGRLAIEAGTELFEKLGFTKDVLGSRILYAYVPEREIENIISGGIYRSDWNLSTAIWKNTQKNKSDIERIVAKGLAENKSVKDIAADLETYVDPNALKPWDWSKVYPWSGASVEYNAQRLARTMIQHAYQTTMCQQQLYNPFCHGIRWHKVGGFKCDVCEERDGKVFPVDDMPLDHPNGMCWFEPVLDDMRTIVDRMSDWGTGGDDYDIDMYILKGLDYDSFNPVGQREVDRIRQKYANRLTD